MLLPTVIAVALSCAVFVSLQWHASLGDNEQRLRTLAVLVAQNVASPLAFLSKEDATRILAALQGEPAVKAAVVFDRNGEPFAVYRTPDTRQPLPDPGPGNGLHREEGRLLMYYPVSEGGRLFGTLCIRWDLGPWYAGMRTYTVGALGVLVACIAVAVLIGQLLQQKITDPILALARNAVQIGHDKDYAVRAAVPDTFELATLALAFNEMVGETQAGHARLAAEMETTRRTEQQLRLITDATPGLISYIGSDGRYRFVNRQYEIWFGLAQDQVIGRTMSEVLGEPTFTRLKPHFDRACSGETVEFEVEAPYREEAVRWIHAHYIPHRQSDGRVQGVFVLVLDMTERKRMEASLAQAHAALERQNHSLEATVQERTARMQEVIGELEAFSYSMAHDMRAPLRSMQGFSRLLLEEHAAGLDEEGKSHLRRIVGSAGRLDHLIQDVLNYSRIVRRELNMEYLDTTALIEEIIATYPNLQPASARIQCDHPLPPVWANTAALTQVVSNLLGNAVKFVKPGTTPEVRISAECFDGPNGSTKWVRLSVTDNGIGIPRSSQHRLFSMFQRLHRPELYEGTGMGLAIVRKAVERMGGRLGVESEEGRGSRFWVELKGEEA